MVTVGHETRSKTGSAKVSVGVMKARTQEKISLGINSQIEHVPTQMKVTGWGPVTNTSVS